MQYVFIYIWMWHFPKLYPSQNVWDLFSVFAKPLLRRCCIWRLPIIHTRIDPSRNVSTPSEETLGIKQGRDVWFQNNATADSFHIVTSRNSKPELTSIFTWLHPAPILVAMHAWLPGDRIAKKLSTPINCLNYIGMSMGNFNPSYSYMAAFRELSFCCSVSTLLKWMLWCNR